MTTITLSCPLSPFHLPLCEGGVTIISVMPRPWNIISAHAVVGVSGVFKLVEGDLCAMFGMGVGAGEQGISGECV